MIVVRVMGGLGNQLFQYACGRSLAERWRAPLLLDISHFAADGKRRFFLDRFRVKAAIARKNEISVCRQALRAFLERTATRFCRLNLRLTTSHIVEKDFRYRPLDAPVHGNAYLDGYWQSERYFETCQDALVNEIQPKAVPSEVNGNLAKEIHSCNSVAVHVRMGDYVSEKRTADAHGACSLSYYKTAMDRIADSMDDPRFFIFSDEPHRLDKDFFRSTDHRIVGHNGEEPQWDLWLMSMCKHQVIANSTFSWWAAWLNRNPEKLVIAPFPWFKGLRHDTSTLLPETWEVLPIRPS